MKRWLSLTWFGAESVLSGTIVSNREPPLNPQKYEVIFECPLTGAVATIIELKRLYRPSTIIQLELRFCLYQFKYFHWAFEVFSVIKFSYCQADHSIASGASVTEITEHT